MSQKIPFYRYSKEQAKSDNDLAAWQESHEANIACARYIGSRETGLSTKAFDGFYVDKDGAYFKNCIETFGWQRTACVLASTFYEKSYDGRISSFNKIWADDQISMMNRDQIKDYVISDYVNPGMFDIMANRFRKEYNELGLYTADHCIPESHNNVDFESRVLVISPRNLSEAYWQPENQIFYATTGFGCSPTASGRKVYGQYLSDGEESVRNRAEFIGVMKDECIPEWVREKLALVNGIQIKDELLIDDDHINAYVETWFDVPKRFGVELGENDSLDLYAEYFPKEDVFYAFCVIKYADGRDEGHREITDLTDAERDAIMKAMEKSGLGDCVAEMSQAPENPEEMEMNM